MAVSLGSRRRCESARVGSGAQRVDDRSEVADGFGVADVGEADDRGVDAGLGEPAEPVDVFLDRSGRAAVDELVGTDAAGA